MFGFIKKAVKGVGSVAKSIGGGSLLSLAKSSILGMVPGGGLISKGLDVAKNLGSGAKSLSDQIKVEGAKSYNRPVSSGPPAGTSYTGNRRSKVVIHNG